MITILNSTINIMGGDLYDHFISIRNLTLIMNKTLIGALKIMKVATSRFGVSNLLELITCFIS
jgi:hypothetical protein